MKKVWRQHAKILLPCAAVLLLLPLLVSFLLPGDAMFAVAMLLFMALNPMLALVMGILAGQDIRHLWYTPLLTAALYWAGATLFITGWNTTIFVYVFAYLLIGAVAMGGSHGVRAFLRKKQAGR